MFGSLPRLGVGLSYRWSLNAHVMRARDHIDWLEFTPEHFLPFNEDAERRLTLLGKRFPMAGHGLELSLGADGPDEPGYRESITRMLACTKSVWHGDHLCFTSTLDFPVRALSAVPFTDEAIETFVRNIPRAQRDFGVPLVVENIAYVVPPPLSTMSEEEFLRRVVVEADAGLLLDLHNIYANARNQKRDPYRMLAALPLDRVVQIHLAGGREIEGIYFDTHTSLCPDEVWEMLDWVVPRCAVRGVNFEMDGHYPPFERLLSELDRARGILRKYGAFGGSS